jgi:ribose transport system permease protein
MAAAAERPRLQKRSAWLWVQHLFVRLGVLPFLLVIAVVVFALMSDRFLSVQNLTNVTRQSTYLAASTSRSEPSWR